MSNYNEYNYIKYDDYYYCSMYNTITFYFVVPKNFVEESFNYEAYRENLLDEIQDMSKIISYEMSIEFPANNIIPRYASVSISPTIETEYGYEDCIWRDINLPYEKIEKLINIIPYNILKNFLQ